MKKVFTNLFSLILFSVYCISCVVPPNGSHESDKIIISTDVFEKVWQYYDNSSGLQNIIFDNKGKVILTTYEREWSVLNAHNGIVLCNNKSKSVPNILGMDTEIVNRVQGDIFVAVKDGGSEIYVYDLKNCGEVAEIRLDDLSDVYDYTIDIINGKVVVLRYYGASAFDLLTGELIWDIKDYSIASQRTSGYLRAFEDYLFIAGKGDIRSVDPETGKSLLLLPSPSDGIRFRRDWMGVDNLFLVQGVAVESEESQFIVVLDAKTGKILSKMPIPNDEIFRFVPIQVVEGRRLLYGYRFPSGDDEPGYCNMYEILETEIRLLWENKGLCGNGVFLDDWIVAKRYPELPEDTKYSSIYYFLDVFTGEVQKTQQFNMYGVKKLYSDGEYLYFLQDHSLVAYEIKK